MISKNVQFESNEGTNTEIDKKLNLRISGQNDIGVFIDKFDKTIQSTCKRYLKSPNTTVKRKSVSWWMDALTTMRKRTNALRKRYQRTLNNEELRDCRKNQYIEGKKKYQAAIRRENKLMEAILQHNISQQPMEPGIQTCIRENTKYGTADNATKSRWNNNTKHKRNSEVYVRTTHSRRQYPRRHRYITQTSED